MISGYVKVVSPETEYVSEITHLIPDWENDGQHLVYRCPCDPVFSKEEGVLSARHNPFKKKPYTKPVLRVYGNITNMTEGSRARTHKTDAKHRSLKTA